MFLAKFAGSGPRMVQIQRQFLRSLTAAAQPKLANKNVWKEALPYEKIPGPSKLQSFISFMPGGKYHNLSFADLHKRLLQEYGPLVKLPGMLGKEDMLIAYNADDFELVS